jgi:hypothetical protein
MLGWLNVVEKALTVTAELYAAHDCVGGLITIPGAIPTNSKMAVLEMITLIDLAFQGVGMRVYVFDSLPTGTYTDGAALDISDADMLNCIAAFDISTADYYACNDNTIACVRNLGIPIKKTNTNLYLLMKTTGAPTWAATSDLVIKAGLMGV